MGLGSGLQSVVIVEDDAGDTFLVAEMLSEVAPDVTLTSFTSMRAALADWPDDADCALLDLGLPDAFGLDALETLRQHVPDVPVVVLTGHVNDTIGPEAVAAGAQDFLVKGRVDAHGLERSLRYAIERFRATAYERDLIAAELLSQENTRLQRGLLPSPLIADGTLGLDLFYRPGSERALLGGDFYDVVQTTTGIHLLIGDVSGHGPDEAALGVALRIAWRALVLAGHTTAEVLRGVERVLLAERNDDASFATVAMVSLRPDLQAADVVLCGHPRPLIVDDNGARELELKPLPMLSMLEDRVIEPVTVPLPADWGLVLFTDGLVEGRRSPGATERVGVEETIRRLALLVEAGGPRDKLAPVLVAEAETCHGGPLTDDVAVMVLGSSTWWR